MEAESNVGERPSRKCKLIPCAVVVCILFPSMLVVNKYLPVLLEKRLNQNNRDWFVNSLDKAAIKAWANSPVLGRLLNKAVPGQNISTSAAQPDSLISLFGWKRNVSRFINSHLFSTAVPEVTSIVGWERDVSRDTTMYIEPFTDTTIIPGKEICGNHNASLVIIVTTSPSSFSKRSLVRETWGSHGNSHVRVAFLVGLATNQALQSSLEDENRRFQDIIQDNFIDTYNNLTLKSIALLKWYIKNCPNSTFLMKSDADTFVNAELLINQLANYPPHGILMGYLCPSCGIRRRADQEWAVPRYMYSNRTYPDFLYGGAYIMTRDVAEKLFAAALKTPLFYLEDVYITGFCAQEAGVSPQQFPGSSKYVWNLKKICLPTLTMCHPIGPDDMRYLWRKRGNRKYEKVISSQENLHGFQEMKLFTDSKSPSYKAVEITSLMWIPLVCTLK